MEAEAQTLGPETMSTSLEKINACSEFLLFYPMIGFGQFDMLLLLPGSVCICQYRQIDFWSIIAFRNIGNVLGMGTWAAFMIFSNG